MPVAGQDGFCDREGLCALQWDRLKTLLQEMWPANQRYAGKWAEAGVDPKALRSLADLSILPFTTKAELLADQERNPPYGDGLTYALPRYTRLHQTSGTSTGQPLRWLDTAASWQRMLDCWAAFYRIVGIGSGDRLFFAFSFGPFLGFWTAFEAAQQAGMFCLAGGGMSGGARLRLLRDNDATVVLCTPTYALHLAEVARKEGIDLPSLSVKRLIVAGEPGGSIGPTRERIEAAWGARVFDHSGMTEIGPTAIECPENPSGLHILETEYLAEVIEPTGSAPVPPGQVGELVLTNLHRWGSPLLRYRTGDLVCLDPKPCPCGRSFLRLQGGILGRTDDMIHCRGNNVYPSALEAVIRGFPEVTEYRVEVDSSGPLVELQVQVEVAERARGDEVAENVAQAIRDRLLFRADVRAVPAGSLPRFEMKAQRVIRK